MDSNEFRVRGTEMVEYICKYMETLNQRRVTPSVEPGYLRHLLPGEAPHNPDRYFTFICTYLFPHSTGMVFTYKKKCFAHTLLYICGSSLSVHNKTTQQ